MRPCNLMVSSTASNIFPPTSPVHTCRPWISVALQQPNLDKNKNQIQKNKRKQTKNSSIIGKRHICVLNFEQSLCFSNETVLFPNQVTFPVVWMTWIQSSSHPMNSRSFFWYLKFDGTSDHLHVWFLRQTRDDILLQYHLLVSYFFITTHCHYVPEIPKR